MAIRGHHQRRSTAKKFKKCAKFLTKRDNLRMMYEENDVKEGGNS